MRVVIFQDREDRWVGEILHDGCQLFYTDAESEYAVRDRLNFEVGTMIQDLQEFLK